MEQPHKVTQRRNNEKKLKLSVAIVPAPCSICNNEKKLKHSDLPLVVRCNSCNNEKKLKHFGHHSA